MDQKLISRRDRAADRQDAALNRWPDRTGPAFLKELGEVVAELRAVVDAGKEDPDRRECSRNWSYLGSALFDLGLARAKTDKDRAVDLLCSSAEAYERAQESLVGIDDPVMLGKISFNYANTLRALSFGEDDGLLAMAEERYRQALSVLRTHAPEIVPVVEAAMSALPAQRKLAQVRDSVGRKISYLDELKRRLVAAEVLSPKPGERSSSENAEMATMMTMLEARLEQDREAGKVTSARHEALKSVLSQLGELLARQGDTMADIAVTLDRLHALTATVGELMKKRGGGANEPPPGSRAAVIARRLADVDVAVGMDRFSRFCGTGETEVVGQLITRVANAEAPLVGMGRDDASAFRHEIDVVRPLAADVRKHLLRHHVMLAWPFWGMPSTPAEANSVHYAGGANVGRLATAAIEGRRLRQSTPPAGTDVADARWESIWSCAVGVFDLTVPEGEDLAAVCFELGIARALGKPVVVLASASGVMPFDVDVVSVTLSGSPQDAERIGHALDDAIYGTPSRLQPNAFAATTAYAHKLWGRGDTRAKALLTALDEAKGDASATVAVLGSLARVVPEPPTLVHPTWPPTYARPGKRFCFHVMPLSRDWSVRVQEACREACRVARVDYRPGDEAKQPDIIWAIWEDICRATHVLVDITGFNANVALELGVACVLGKKLLVTAQKGTVGRLFPMMAKMRVVTYELRAADTTLAAAVGDFVGR